ncbi:DUF4123 domain-containing protein [Motilimonas sp. KMU-193]|uniref:DUF4123 domain-containing protein n=1 Tax=Motilimonas sp. KMU-193 TaxID=3388668 RepID=UPI00396B3017
MTESYLVPDISLHQDERLFLYLDGSRFENVLKTIYEFEDCPDITIIYTATQWESLSSVSPCLIEIDLTSPLYRFILDNPFQRYGYFIAAKDRLMLEAHLRRLIVVSPPYGETVMLKFADPEVAARLLVDSSSECWGPIEQVWLPCVRSKTWQQKGSCQVNGFQQSQGTIRLTEAQYSLLGEVSHLNFIFELKRYMEKWFLARLPKQQVLDWLYHWSDRAYQLGFTSQQAQKCFLAVVGYLGEDVFQQPQFAQIQQYLTQASTLTPDLRAEKAAELAHGYWLKQNQKEVS